MKTVVFILKDDVSPETQELLEKVKKAEETLLTKIGGKDPLLEDLKATAEHNYRMHHDEEYRKELAERVNYGGQTFDDETK